MNTGNHRVRHYIWAGVEVRVHVQQNKGANIPSFGISTDGQRAIYAQEQNYPTEKVFLENLKSNSLFVPSFFPFLFFVTSLAHIVTAAQAAGWPFVPAWSWTMILCSSFSGDKSLLCDREASRLEIIVGFVVGGREQENKRPDNPRQKNHDQPSKSLKQEWRSS